MRPQPPSAPTHATIVHAATTRRMACAAALSALLLATILLAPRPAAAVEPAAPAWPTKPIKLVVGATAGGGVDTLARLLTAELQQPLGQALLVENRPGAGQNIGSAYVARAAADGYTLLVTSSSFAVNVNLYANAGYDPVRDFAPVALLSQSPNLLVVRPGVPARTLAEFISYAKGHQPPLSYSSSGVGNTQHLSTELFKLKTGIAATHIPYGGSAPSLLALLNGTSDFTFVNISSVQQHLREGKLRALALTSSKRSPVVPDVPTMEQAGMAGMDVSAWYGVLAPTGTPPAVVARLNTAIDTLLARPDFVARLDKLGMDPIVESPAYFSHFLQEDMVRWKATIDGAHIKVE